MVICEIWLFDLFFPQYYESTNLICRSTDKSKCFRLSLRFRDNESQLYIHLFRHFKLFDVWHSDRMTALEHRYSVTFWHENDCFKF